ncbi:MAG: exodeoxyribonuclease V subunit beta [Gemmatimonadaceae bacterium]
MKDFDPRAPLAKGITLLEASAGTGKTHSITSLVLRLILEDQLPIERILVVTFTEGATSELRERIRGRLRDARVVFSTESAERVPIGDETLAQLFGAARAAGTLREGAARLQEALERFDTAAIFTIHGFCSHLLGEHAFECGADFDAQLLADPSELLDEVTRDFWARVIDRRSPELVTALVNGRKLEFDNLLALAKIIASDPTMAVVPPPLAQEKVEAAIDECTRIRERLTREWNAEGKPFHAVLRKAVDDRVLTWQSKWVDSRLREMTKWLDGPSGTAPPEQFAHFCAAGIAKYTKRSTPPSHPVFDLCEEFSVAHEKVQLLLDVAHLALLHESAEWTRTEFERRKRARHVQTYDDLLLLVRHALRDPEHGPSLTRSVRARLSAALIDEFQDTDDVQWEIFRTLFGSDDCKLVLIGDPKQSIYSFRGADVYAFLNAKGASHQSETLTKNWRSDAPLVRAMNTMFGRLASPFALQGITYAAATARDDASRLSGDLGSPFQIRFIRRATVDARPDAPVNKAIMNEAIPGMVADDIVRFLTSGATMRDSSGNHRVVSPGDLAVLVRKGKQSKAIQLSLRRKGVPSVQQGAASIFDSVEADEFESILAAVLEPSSMGLVRAALATDLLGVALAKDLTPVGSIEPLTIGEALVLLESDDSSLERWIQHFREWNLRLREYGVMSFVRRLSAQLELPAVLLSLTDGERRLTNLFHIAELLHAASSTEGYEGTELLDWLRKQCDEDESGKDERQIRLETDADAVTIATIHSSKGLEYPVVWCPYLWDSFFISPSDKRYIRFHERENGSYARKLDIDPAISPSVDRATHSSLQTQETFAESLRLMYVALTRARHRCTVYWSAVNAGECSALGWLFHGGHGDTIDEGMEELRETLKGIEDDDILAALRAIAEESGNTIAVQEEMCEDLDLWVPPRREVEELGVRHFGRTSSLDSDWGRSSFTGITRKSHEEYLAVLEGAPEAIVDARVAALETAVPDQLLSTPSLLPDFPASAKAGIFFHELLENRGSKETSISSERVALMLRKHGFDEKRWAHPVEEAVNALLNAPLSSDADRFSLRDVPVTARLVELGFELPVCGGFDAPVSQAFSAHDLARVFEEHPGGAVPSTYAAQLAQLRFTPLRGFMSGFLDLVFEQSGRWYILDYKSNRLGSERTDYSADRLTNEMGKSHYILQYHLYIVALHRYLKLRLAGYDYEKHFGEAIYLFLRGIDPGGSSSGTFVDRPPMSRIEALDAALSPSLVLP